MLRAIAGILLLLMPLLGFAEDIPDWNNKIKINIVPAMDPVTKETTYDISEIQPNGVVVKVPRYSNDWNHYYREALNREPPLRPESREMYRILVKMFEQQLKSKKVRP